ncbi:hypothetical protein LOTGIDRAFT_168567 [Lottia gigantea]|uniref:Odorant receptor n=1 Tax=Lottia gigantea TaxID=225164 RepID=V3Z289_LOTGI|nr:hypothetical protein LOTGIDRAFT_168567 [Lottia gigantea]ESO84698.1 hypothetical protein LOTGIDRAFT_168567 [Lottia gigantea]
MSLDFSSTHKALKPLLYYLLFFGLCRPFPKPNKLVMVIFVLTFILQIWMIIMCFWKVVVCFQGAENPTEPENISLYIIAILVAINETFYFLYGLFYGGKRFEAFIAFTEELQSDPIYNVNFDKLKRNVTIFIIITSVCLSVSFLVLLITNLPIFNPDFSCFFSPYNIGSPGYWIHISSLPVLAVLVLGQTIGIFGILTAVCYMVKTQLTVCNIELEKLVKSTPTTKKIVEIRKRFFSIHRYCQLADNALTPLVATNIVINFLIVCLFANTLSYGKFGPTEIVTYPIIMLFCFFEITFIVVNCTLVNEKGKCCLETAVYLEGSKMDDKTISVLFGTLVTYIVLVIQLKPA